MSIGYRRCDYYKLVKHIYLNYYLIKPIQVEVVSMEPLPLRYSVFSLFKPEHLFYFEISDLKLYIYLFDYFQNNKISWNVKKIVFDKNIFL